MKGPLKTGGGASVSTCTQQGCLVSENPHHVLGKVTWTLDRGVESLETVEYKHEEEGESRGPRDSPTGTQQPAEDMIRCQCVPTKWTSRVCNPSSPAPTCCHPAPRWVLHAPQAGLVTGVVGCCSMEDAFGDATAPARRLHFHFRVPTASTHTNEPCRFRTSHDAARPTHALAPAQHRSGNKREPQWHVHSTGWSHGGHPREPRSLRARQ